MRAFLTGLALLLLGAAPLQARDELEFRPDGAGEFFFSALDPIPRNLTGGEGEVVLDYGDWSFILESGFLPSGRTLVQFFFDARRTGETLIDRSPSRPAGGAVFFRPWRGGSLSYSPLSPDRVTGVGNGKETVLLDERPGGILMFFETGDDIFWLGNGREFYSYDESGRCLAKYGLEETALMAAADSAGALYLASPEGTVLSLPPYGRGEAREGVVSYSAWDVISSCYGDAASLIEDEFPGYAKAFGRWVLDSAEALYREDPLNRELGDFIRSLGNVPNL